MDSFSSLSRLLTYPSFLVDSGCAARLPLIVWRLCCFLSLAFICLCPFINGFLSFHLVLVQSWIVLRDFLAPTALAWMAKLLLYSFFSYFIKIFSFSPLYLLRLLALYCGLRVVLSYRSILLHFFCYFGPRSFSHIVHSWGIGSNPVPFVNFDIWWRFEIVALAMWMWTDMEYLVIVAPYGWRGIYILDFLLFFMITHFVYCNWQLHVLRNYVILAYLLLCHAVTYQGQVLCIALASFIGSVWPRFSISALYIKMLGYNSVNHIQLKIVKD